LSVAEMHLVVSSRQLAHQTLNGHGMLRLRCVERDENLAILRHGPPSMLEARLGQIRATLVASTGIGRAGRLPQTRTYGLAGSVHQVLKPIVSRRAVPVSGFVSGRAGADEGFEHHLVHLRFFRLAVFRVPSPPATLRVHLELHDFAARAAHPTLVAHQVSGITGPGLPALLRHRTGRLRPPPPPPPPHGALRHLRRAGQCRARPEPPRSRRGCCGP
jgi:hypothetical protein